MMKLRFILGFLLSTGPVGGFQCPDNFDDLAGVNMCIIEIPNEVTFAQARKNCHDQGAELASVLSAGEQGAIVKYLMDPPYSKGIEDGPRRIKGLFWWHWLDATNDNSDEKWRWTVKGIEIPLSETPTYWDFEEPANSISCLVMQSGRFGFDRYWRHWKSYDCLMTRPYLCQIRYTDNDI